MRRLVPLLVLSACTFDPPQPLAPEDAGPEVRDGGVARRDAGPGPFDGGPAPDGATPDGGDPNEIDGGQDNMPPIPSAGPDRDALPWDTVLLSATDSVDPDGNAMTYSWSVALPPGATTGLGPFPGDDQTVVTGVEADLYVSVPGDYLVTVRVSDGGFVRTATATIAVRPFEMVPLPDDDEVETVLVTPWSGALWIGTKGKGLNRLGAAAVPPPDVIACVGNAKINALAESATGTLAVAAEDGFTIFDGDCRPPPANAPTKVRATVVAENDEDFYFAGDPGIVLHDISTNLLTPFRLDFAGDKQKYRGAARDGSGVYWFGSDANDPDDGIAGSLPPPNQGAPRVDVFAGADDKINAIRAGAGRELWIAAEPGVAQIASADNPTAILRFTPGAGLPEAIVGPFEDVAIVPRGDVWIASKDGVIRYKRDVSQMVVMPRGEYGIPAGGEMRGIAVDSDGLRGRTVYAGGKAGLHAARATARSSP